MSLLSSLFADLNRRADRRLVERVCGSKHPEGAANRLRVYEALSMDVGYSEPEMAARTGLHWTSCRVHLQKLRDSGFATSTRSRPVKYFRVSP